MKHILALLVACAISSCLAPLFGASLDAPLVDWSPTIRMPADGSLSNPLRGYYQWLTYGTIPRSTQVGERYFRPTWRELETSEAQYDFTVIDKQLAKLKAGDRICFGVMAVSSVEPGGICVPDYLVTRLSKGFFAPRPSGTPATFYIPDWNDPLFLQRAEALFKALGAKYDGDPRIAFIDIRMYGNYGEWHDWGAAGPVPYDDHTINKNDCRPGTAETKHRLVDVQVRAFPHTRLVMMTDDTDSLLYALRLKTAIPIGMRRDSWGWTHFVVDFLRGRISDADKKLVMDRWKIAPFIVEPAPHVEGKRFQAGLAALSDQVRDYHISAIGNYNFVSGRWSEFEPDEQRAMIAAGNLAGYNLVPRSIRFPSQAQSGATIAIDATWVNLGSAPTYEEWKVNYSLLDARGTLAWTQISSFDLKRALPGDQPVSKTDRFRLPKELVPGEYKLVMQVVDPAGYRLPMNIAISDQPGPSGINLGAVRVTR